ncbi:MAG TPA: phospholipase D-like domain-containing protein [Propionibacteriaceae bacterium]|nr:phospholipase D-like domain-containing protein [Propionibacteriaceae bacterium]
MTKALEPRRRTVLAGLRRWVPPIASVVVGAEVSAAIAVTVAASLRRRHHRTRRFPTAPPLPATVGDNTVRIYTFGKDLYADMLEAIDSATESVRLETFIWKGDEVGQQFKDAVERAAARGVDVHLIIDQFANLVVPQSFYAFSDRIHVRWHPLFGPIGRIDHRNGGRDHRKLLIVDGTVAFLGGYNIGSLYADKWRDTHARFTGPVVGEIDQAFVDQWNITPRGWFHQANRSNQLETSGEREWGTDIRIHKNSPRMAVYPIRNMYLEAIDKASTSIHITQAYFAPDDDFLAALFAAARRGVDVRIIIPAESNHVLADWLSRGFYDELLADGIRIFLYQGAMVHAKTGTIDGIWSTIGTANLDRLSLLGNYEINAEITGEEVAQRMEEIFEIDLSNCIEVTLDTWRARSKAAKLTEALLAPWRPLV